MSTLFERLVAQAPAGQRPWRQYEFRQTSSFDAIKRHLETLLNTRQGCSQSSPDLGLRDFNSHDFSDTDVLREVSADIHRTISRYEPRIQIQSLHGIPNVQAPLELHLRLDCHVQVDDCAKLLQIDLLVDGHSRYTRVR